MKKSRAHTRGYKKSDHPRNDPWNRIEWVLGLLALSGAAAFHVKQMYFSGALWRDEVSTLNLACMPTLSEFWKNLVFDPFPALYFFTVRAWAATGWGGTDAGLRLFGCLTGLAILGAFCWNARVIGLRFPFISLLLVGFNPVEIRWADSVRAYGLGTFFILLTFGSIWKMTRSPTRPRVALAIAMAVMSVQCMYQNSALIFGICIGASLVGIRKTDWRRALLPLGAGSVAGLSLIPYLGVLKKAQDWTMLSATHVEFDDLFQKLSQAISEPLPIFLWIWLILAALTVLASVHEHFNVADPDSSTDRRDLALFGAATLLVGTISFFTFLLGVGFPTQVWYYTPLLSLAAIALDTTLAPAWSGKPARKWALVALISASLLVSPLTWHALESRQTAIDRIATELLQRATPQDLILVRPWYLAISFLRYYKGSTPCISAPPLDDLSIHRWDLVKARMISYDPLNSAFRRIEETLKAGNRLWLVSSSIPLPKAVVPTALPPAPGSRFGWNNTVYAQLWSWQIDQFLEIHKAQKEGIRLSSPYLINGLENPTLDVASGWAR